MSEYDKVYKYANEFSEEEKLREIHSWIDEMVLEAEKLFGERVA